MADQEHTPIDETTTQAPNEKEDFRDQLRVQSEEIAAAYHRARTELTEALSRLREELERLDVEQARQKTQDWIKNNPTLATFIAIGGGIVVGKLISNAFKPAPPPPVTRRAGDKARLLAREAQRLAAETGGLLGTRASEAGDVLGQKARKASTILAARASDLSSTTSKKAGEVAEVLSERASELGDILSEKASVYGEAAIDRMEKAAETLQDVAQDFARTIKKKSKKGIDVTETALDAAKTAIVAVLVQRANDWIRKLT